jgi:PRC-barrel domain
MLKQVLVAGLLAATFAVPAWAQEKQPPPTEQNQPQQSQPPAAQPEATLVGLPVYSSDGEKLGEVTHVGTAGGQQAVRAEMGTFLGMGTSPVIIPAEMFEHKADRLQVQMTAAEVRDSISKQKK